jgi:penicillin amidase
MKRKIIIICSVIGGIIVLAGISLLVLYFTQKESYNDKISADVKGEIVIQRGEDGMPHIEVKNEEDMYFTLGYLHSQDRNSLIEYYRSIATGHASKVIGKKGELLDRLSRSIGFLREASVIYKNLKDAQKVYIKAYVKGINLTRGRGLQANFLRDDWKEEDVIAILLMKEWANAFLNNKENFFRLPIIKKDWNVNKYFPEDLLFFYYDDEEINLSVIKKLEALVEEYIGTFNRGFAVSILEKATKSGKPYTAYSYDDKLSVYPGWYPVQIRINGSVFRAVTFNGLPFIFSGNRSGFSFFGFNLNIDTQDYVIEKVKIINDAPQYLSPNGWKNFSAHEFDPGKKAKKESKPEKIEPTVADSRDIMAVKKKKYDDSFISSIFNQSFRYTENGPVLNDIFTDSPPKTDVVVLKFIRPDADYIGSLFEMPFAKDMNAAKAAVLNTSSLPKVYFFTENNETVKAFTGKIPARQQGYAMFKQGLNTGWIGMNDISQYYTGMTEETAMSFYPTEIINQVRVFAIIEEDRYAALKTEFDNFSAMSEKDLENFLTSKNSVLAEKFIPVFLSILSTNPTTSARLTRIFFHDWNYSIDSESVAPTLYQVILEQFIYNTFKDDYKEDIDDIMKKYHHMSGIFYKLVHENTTEVFDDITTDKPENRETIFDISFLKANRILNRSLGPIMADWKWGKIHKGHFHIPYEESNFLNRILYKIDDLPFEGGAATIFLSQSDRDLKPNAGSSLFGYFGTEISNVTMNFAYSVNPMSTFYYGRKRSVNNADFDKVTAKFFTIIKPNK